MTSTEQPLVFTVDEAAVLMRISRGLAFAAVRDGTLPHIRIGRRILIPRDALHRLLEAASSDTSTVPTEAASQLGLRTEMARSVK